MCVCVCESKSPCQKCCTSLAVAVLRYRNTVHHALCARVLFNISCKKLLLIVLLKRFARVTFHLFLTGARPTRGIGCVAKFRFPPNILQPLSCGEQTPFGWFSGRAPGCDDVWCCARTSTKCHLSSKCCHCDLFGQRRGV